MTLPPGHRFEATQALRQTLTRAVEWGLVGSNPATTGVDNAQPPRREMRPFDSDSQLEALAAELGPRYGPMVLFAAATGLRPGEWIALERRDIDLDNRLVHVRRAFRVNRLKTTKTDTPRAVPLQRSALDALDQLPSPPTTTSLLFPAPEGGFLDLHTGDLATGAPRSSPPASPRSAASTICATRSPPSRCAPDSANRLDAVSTVLAVVVLSGAVAILAAGAGCLRSTSRSAAAAAVDSAPLVLGLAGAALACVAIFVNYDGFSSLWSVREGESAEFFFEPMVAVAAMLAGLALLGARPRFACGLLLAVGTAAALHYLGLIVAAWRAIGEVGDTRAAGFIGVLGGLLVVAAGAWVHRAVSTPGAGRR